MKTIGEMSKQFGLSRSTLLYYDKIGLLSPSARSISDYRLYNQSDIERMTLIMLYRQAGLSLSAITDLLDKQTNSTDKSELKKILINRLGSLNQEIDKLRQQQQFILTLLDDEVVQRQTKFMNKEQWIQILVSSGMTETDMTSWHTEFERHLPEMHHDFLQSLGIEEKDIAKIRQQSQRLVSENNQ